MDGCVPAAAVFFVLLCCFLLPPFPCLCPDLAIFLLTSRMHNYIFPSLSARSRSAVGRRPSGRGHSSLSERRTDEYEPNAEGMGGAVPVPSPESASSLLELNTSGSLNGSEYQGSGNPPLVVVGMYQKSTARLITRAPSLVVALPPRCYHAALRWVRCSKSYTHPTVVTMADVEEPVYEEQTEEVEEAEEEEAEEEEYETFDDAPEIKLFGKWSFDDVEVRDISLVVSFPGIP